MAKKKPVETNLKVNPKIAPKSNSKLEVRGPKTGLNSNGSSRVTERTKPLSRENSKQQPSTLTQSKIHIDIPVFEQMAWENRVNHINGLIKLINEDYEFSLNNNLNHFFQIFLSGISAKV